MKKSFKDKSCSYCHLEKLIPLREVKKILFFGILKKGSKKHEIKINLAE
jgi:hypothetical protein